jgi:oligosaccharide repeat unit polymerase
MSWNIFYTLDIVAMLSFLASYYWNCYRRGYRIDFWHTQLFLICVLPNLILFPFSSNELNELIVHQDFASVVTALPSVFLIALLGYLAILTGGGLWSLRVGLGLRKAAIQMLDIIPRSSRMLMSSRSVLVFQASLCIILQLMILAVYFVHSGFGFDLRDFTFAYPELRPVAVAISSYSVVIASHCLARYMDTREKVLLGSTLLLTFGLVFFGARSNLLGIFLSVFICHLVKQREKIKLFRTIGLIFVILIVGLYLGSARAGDYSLVDFFGALMLLVFYGNNFSDLRDFAWVYGKWDHSFWIGKTYLAGITSFVPRFASQFRDTWGLGVATDTVVGLDPQTHPGLRPGYFGEGFFNFGLFGVIVVGLIIGIILRRIDIDTKRALSSPHPSTSRAFASTMLLSLIGSIAASVNVSSLYVLGGIYLFSWLCICVQRMVFWHRISPAAVD